MSYARWGTGNGPWYAWGGRGPSFDADGNHSPPPTDGPLVLALWHHEEDHAVHITSDKAEAMMRGEVKLQSLFSTALTPKELQSASAILVEFLEDMAEEAAEKEGQE